ncbi:MAG TPA: transglycosylase domain-containing protein [Acidimicrobiia bacterium]|nr:transglycosylase domain-containing protein [Acidimicrobiia bacterium]
MKLARFAVTFLLIVALGATALATSLALLVPAAQTFTAAVSPIESLQQTLTTPAQRSYVYDRNGKLMTTLFDVDRSPVELSAIPKQLLEAVIAIEDRKFYQHNGVDLAGMFRAFTRDAGSGKLEQGASTITQQLVKNVWRRHQKRDFKEKAKEAWLAVQLETKLSKAQILEHYLNFVPFGNNAYGVEAASERYFDKPVGELRLAESALLAGLVQAPTALDPITHPAEAARRRGQVLDAMLKTHKITAAQRRAANQVPLPTHTSYPNPSQRSYYIDALISQLEHPDAKDPSNPANALGRTAAEARRNLYRGGYRIYTNYDPVMQFTADLAISGTIPKNQDQFTATLVSIDNSNGAVRAVAFGRGYSASQFDPAVDGAGRQAGSSFKAITLAAALSAGYSPDDRVPAYSLHWKIGLGDDYYNLSGDCHGGTPTLTQAIAKSDNCAFVRTELSLGPGNYGADGARRVEAMAAQMGIDVSHFYDPPVVSTTLGTNGVHGLEMAQAYSVIAADGVLHRAQYVAKIVTPRGKVIFANTKHGKRILTPEVARTETQMLTGVLENGTASGLSIGRPAAGKTGTTDKNVDAWFIGYTPQLTTAVWMGDPNGENSMSNVGGISVFGATYPADIWKAFMEAAHANLPVVDFIPPDEDLWPSPQRIDEFGRHENYYSSRPYVPTQTTIATVPATTPITPAPPIVAPTTSPPPTTKPAKSPKPKAP